MSEEHKQFVGEHRKQWPVIFLDLSNTICTHSSIDILLRSFGDAMQKAYDAHADYLEPFFDSCTQIYGGPLKQDIVQFRAFHARQCDPMDVCKNGIFVLAKLLYKFYRKRVIVIVDGFDTPIQSAMISKSLSVADVGYCINLVQTLLHCAYSNGEFIERALVAGNYHVDVPGASFIHFVASSSPTPTKRFFGLSNDEFAQLCELYEVDARSKAIASARFNGFEYSRSTSSWEEGTNENGSNIDNPVPLYSTCSVIQFFIKLRTQQLNRNYGGTHMKEPIVVKAFEDLFLQRQIWELLSKLANKFAITVEPIADGKFSVNELIELKRLHSDLKKPIKLHASGIGIFFTFLRESGYLISANGLSHKMGVPNEEARLLLATRLCKNYSNAYGIEWNTLLDVADELEKLLCLAADPLGDPSSSLLSPSNSTSNVVVADPKKLPQAVKRCVALELAIKALFEAIPQPILTYEEFKANPKQPGVRGNESLVQFLLAMASLQTPNWDRLASDYRVPVKLWQWLDDVDKNKALANKKNPDPNAVRLFRPDIYLRSADCKVGVVIELKFGEAETALDALIQIGRDGYMQQWYEGGEEGDNEDGDGGGHYRLPAELEQLVAVGISVRVTRRDQRRQRQRRASTDGTTGDGVVAADIVTAGPNQTFASASSSSTTPSAADQWNQRQNNQQDDNKKLNNVTVQALAMKLRRASGGGDNNDIDLVEAISKGLYNLRTTKN